MIAVLSSVSGTLDSTSILIFLRLVWLLFIVFTMLHLMANYRAVSVVSMETLNKNRLHLVVSTYMKTGKVPSVKWVNAREPVVLCKSKWPVCN